MAWAVTPWKEQGMTLERVVVKIGDIAASKQGILFVSLSRVKHPDHLMIDDSFPMMSIINQQKLNPAFAARQLWEKKSRAKFSRTIRKHMRAAVLFQPQNVWTEQESNIADELVGHIRNCGHTDFHASLQIFLDAVPLINREMCSDVCDRMLTFPHIFEFIEAQNLFLQYDSKGVRTDSEQRHVIRRLSLQKWWVNIHDIENFLFHDVLTIPLAEFWCKILRMNLEVKGIKLHYCSSTLRLKNYKSEDDSFAEEVFFQRSDAGYWLGLVFEWDTRNLYVILPGESNQQMFQKTWEYIATCLNVQNIFFRTYDVEAKGHAHILQIVHEKLYLTQDTFCKDVGSKHAEMKTILKDIWVECQARNDAIVENITTYNFPLYNTLLRIFDETTTTQDQLAQKRHEEIKQLYPKQPESTISNTNE